MFLKLGTPFQPAFAFVLLICGGFSSVLAQTVTLSPATVSYGNQVTGTSSVIKTVTLKNGQTVALTITSIATNLSVYTASTNCPASPAKLAAGAKCTISITFTPTALGATSATLSVTDNASNSPLTVSLSGTGVAAVTATPGSLSFGNQAIGKKSAASKVTLRNNQTSALTINSISTNLSDYSTTTTCPLTPNTLAAASTCNISVFFTPASEGTRGATLTVNDNASVSPTVSLTGNGIVPALVTPTSLSFPGQAKGTTSAAQSVTLTNNQSTALTISSIASSLSDFLVTSTCPLSPQTLAAGASCAASVTFSPKATGARSGTLTFKDNANNTPQTVSLSGTGLAANLVSIALSPQPDSIALGLTQQFTATGTYTDGTTQNLSNSVTWNSSATSVATIGTKGLATSKAQGTTTISATSGAITGSGTLTVTAPVLVSIAVTPASTTIPLGKTQQFAAVGTYSNQSTQNLTNSVTWGTSAPALIMISSQGLATSLAEGTATITATSGTVIGSGSLTVSAPALVSLSVSPSTASVPLGTEQQFTATGTYTNGSTQNLSGAVSWSSSPSTVAIISGAGLASSAGEGSATISASLGSVSASGTLTVGQPILVSLAITPSQPSFALGTTQQLKATGTYSDGSTLDLTNTATWNTNSAAIATVNNQGLASSVAIGSTSVTASLGSITGTTTLNITPATMVSITVTPAIQTIPLGTTEQFSATARFTDGTTQNVTNTAQWSSDTGMVATISNGGNSPGLAASVSTGTTNISASVGSVSGGTTLTVSAAALVSIAVTPAAPSIALGTNQQFTATGTLTDGSTQDPTKSATWASDTPATATVNPTTGMVQSVAMGSADISATQAGISGSAQLTVTAAVVVSIQINPATANIPLGTTQQFTAIGTYSDSTTQDITQSGHWSSTVGAVATISNSAGSQGLTSTVSSGSTSIGISLAGVSSSATLTVSPAALVSIAISPQAPTIALGTTEQFAASGTYTDGNSKDITASVSWSSSSLSTAVVSNDAGSSGLATSAAQGATTITASLGSVSSSTTLTVGQAAITSIAVSPSSILIPLGYAQQFTAIATNTDGSTQDITQSATWTSSVPNVAAVDATGLASSLLVGTTTVSASAGSVTGSVLLTVNSPVPVSLVITPADPPIFVGAQQQFSATLTYSNGSLLNVTSAAIWSSDSPAVATVNSTGLASAIAQGTAHIMAAASGLTGSATLTVSMTGPGTQIASTGFGFQCANNNTSAGSCRVGGTLLWPTTLAQPGMVRLWDTEVDWYGLDKASGTYNWTNLDNWLNVIAAENAVDGAQAMYTIGWTPFWDAPTSPSSCQSGTSGSPCPPKDLPAVGAGGCSTPGTTACGSATFDAFITALLGHCSPGSPPTGGNCVSTYIKYWELWNEANASNRWTGTQQQLYQLMAPAVAIIKANITGATIVSPPVANVSTPNPVTWMCKYLSQEATYGILSNVYGFHGELNNGIPENQLPTWSNLTRPNTSYASACGGSGWTQLPQWHTELSFSNTENPGADGPYVCDETVFSAADCAGQVVRAQLLTLGSGSGIGASSLMWYSWLLGIGNVGLNDTAYYWMMQYLVGGTVGACSNVSGTVWTCSGTESNGTLTEWVWTTSESSGQTYIVPSGYTDYKDLTGGVTEVTPGTNVAISVEPIMLEQPSP